MLVTKKKPTRAKRRPYVETIAGYKQTHDEQRVAAVMRMLGHAEELQAIRAEMPVASAPPAVQRLFRLAENAIADQDRMLRETAADEGVLRSTLWKEAQGVVSRKDNKADATDDRKRIRAACKALAEKKPHLTRRQLAVQVKAELESLPAGSRLVRSESTIYTHAKGLGKGSRS